jgi:hypothetical protein
MLEEPHRARRDYALHVHLLLELNEHLRRDGRFHGVAWFDPEGWRNNPEMFDTPVSGDIPSIDVPHDPGIETKRSLFDNSLLH